VDGWPDERIGDSGRTLVAPELLASGRSTQLYGRRSAGETETRRGRQAQKKEGDEWGK